MRVPLIKALVASEDKPWRSAFVEALYDEGCDLDVATSGFEALHQLRKQTYGLVIVDDSFSDLSALELCLNLRDLVPEMPIVMVSGDNLGKYIPFWRRFGFFFVGRRTAVLRNVGNAVERARHRMREAGPVQ